MTLLMKSLLARRCLLRVRSGRSLSLRMTLMRVRLLRRRLGLRLPLWLGLWTGEGDAGDGTQGGGDADGCALGKLDHVGSRMVAMSSETTDQAIAVPDS